MARAASTFNSLYTSPQKGWSGRKRGDIHMSVNICHFISLYVTVAQKDTMMRHDM